MIIITTSPQLIQPVYNPIYLEVSSDQTAQDTFSFIFDLYINGNFVNRDRLLPRPATIKTIYSPARILESYLSFDKFQNVTGVIPSANAIDQYQVICGEEYINPWSFSNNSGVTTTSIYSGYTLFYTTGATTNPFTTGDTVYVVQNVGYSSSIYNGVCKVLSANTTGIIVDIKHTINTPVNAGKIYYSDKRKTVYTGATAASFTGYTFNGVIQYEEVPNWNYTKYLMQSGATGSWLTKQPPILKTRIGERGTIGWMAIQPFVSANTYFMRFAVTTNTGTTTNDFSIPSMANSGFRPSNQNYLILDYGVYPYNLNNIYAAFTLPPAVDTNTISYTAQLVAILVSGGSKVAISNIQTFAIDQDCTKYNPVRFQFLNSLGQFDFFTATLVSRETINITKNTYTKSLPFNYQVGDRGKTVINIDAQQTYVVTSNWIEEETYAWLTELFLSQEVYILNDDGSLIPIIIDNTTIEKKKRVNDQLLNLTFNYTKAVKLNTARN